MRDRPEQVKPKVNSPTFRPLKSVVELWPAAFPVKGTPSLVHWSYMNCGGLTSCCASVGASKNVYASPASRCHSMWQWKNHVPGLSVRNRMVTEPPGGICTVSRHNGLVSPSTIGGLSSGSSEATSHDLCTMANLCPCKWLSNRN
jgi:hypothetical protein